MSEAGAALLASVERVRLERGGTVILEDATFRVRTGEHTLILGPNGCGKTTLLKVVQGYEWATQGRVTLFGETLGGGANLPELRKAVGWAGAALADAMAPDVPAREVVLTGRDAWLRPWRKYTAEELAEAEDWLEHLGARHVALRPFGLLSVGEKQRVLIARALAAQTRLLLLDEVCAGLDPGAREALIADLSAAVAGPSRPTVIFVTHHLDEAPPFISHALLMRAGRTTDAGPAEAILTSERMSALFGAPFTVVRGGGRYALLPGAAPA